MKTVIVLGLVIVTLLLILFILVDKATQMYNKKGKIHLGSEDCVFSVGSTYYTISPGDEIEIGKNITVVFSKNTQATIRVRGDVDGNIISRISDITVSGDIKGNIQSGSGDVIINGNTKNITTGSGDVIVNGCCEGSATSESGNVTIEPRKLL